MKLILALSLMLAAFLPYAFSEEEEKAVAAETVGDKSDDFLKGLKEDDALDELTDAIRKNNLERVDKILQLYPALLNKKDKFGATPFFNSVHSGNMDIVEFLAERKADVQQGNMYGDSPLHVAAESGYIEIMQFLLNKGAYAWIANNKGETPLFKAVSRGHESSVGFLLENGANIHATDKAGNTCLHRAALKGDLKMIEFLIDKGAKPQAKNKAGKKAADIARSKKVKNYLVSKDSEEKSEQNP